MLTSLTPVQKVVLVIAAAALVLGVGLTVVSRANRAEPGQPTAQYEPAEPGPAPIHVDVVGEVVRPGLYRLPAGGRVEDAVRAAGGFTSRARVSSVNRAAFLDDGQQVCVEAKASAETSTSSTAMTDETPREPATASPSQPPRSRTQLPIVPVARPAPQPEVPATTTPTTPMKPQRVRLNSAGLEKLQELPGVGPELAQRILYYRHEHGKFRSFEELGTVKGVGAKTIANIRTAATLN